MTRLRQPGDSHYDVLGLSPGASDQEIDRAFRRLTDGQGYKVGVPLNRQWLRGRQIKEAHATLSDPVMRRAYDESLARAPQGAPWAMAANDPATDELILPRQEPDGPEPVQSELLPDAVVVGGGTMVDSVAEPTPASEPDAEEVDRFGAEVEPPPALAPAFNEDQPTAASAPDTHQRDLRRTWGVAAAVAVGVALVSLAFWSSGNDGLSTSETPLSATSSTGQAEGAGTGFVRQTPGNSQVAAVSEPDPREAAAGESPAGEMQGAIDQQTAQHVGGSAASETADAQSEADTKAGTPPPEASSPPMGTGEARAAAPTPTPPADGTLEITPTPPSDAGNSGSMIRNAPEWLGGGPTDQDNPRGRYQGTVGVQIIVERDGRVSQCAAVRGSGDAGLDALTCRLVRQRARFSPALDAQGQPVVSETYTTFFWGRRQRKR